LSDQRCHPADAARTHGQVWIAYRRLRIERVAMPLASFTRAAPR